MVLKCVHKSCGKTFTDVDEECVYHPGPPVFHEGQKGWRCCKSRVLTFDEFLTIPPCTKGKHSTVEDSLAANEPSKNVEVPAPTSSATRDKRDPPLLAQTSRMPRSLPTMGQSAPSSAPSESEEDDPTLKVPVGKQCRRRGCYAIFGSELNREAENCIHHPGQPIFHEGAKGWSCCKKRVTDFDDFLSIPGCTTNSRHMFVGRGKANRVEKLRNIRHDFYQTSSNVIASIFLKEIDNASSSVTFDEKRIWLDLRASDEKHYVDSIPVFGVIDPKRSHYNVMKTKLELTLAKMDGAGWPVLRADERHSGEIIQTGSAGVA